MKYCCSLLLLLMSISSSAQKRNIELNGKIFDAFTRTGVEGTVVLLNEHDIPLDTVEAKATAMMPDSKSMYQQNKPHISLRFPHQDTKVNRLFIVSNMLPEDFR